MMTGLIRQFGLVACILISACVQPGKDVGNQKKSNVEADREVSAGKQIYAQCIGCHSPGWHRTGPSHCGLLGRRAGSIAGFDFTQAMEDSGIIWTQETLDRFLQAPLLSVPGTSMGFAGIVSATDRQQLIDYLSQLNKNNPVCR